jgi:spore germination protein YaaH
MRNLFVFVVLSTLIVPTPATAALEVGGWIPWWQDEEGTESAERHLRDLDVVYPFVYEVDDDGEIVDRAGLGEDHWEDLFRKADRRRVDVIPTIAWFDGPAIHEVLSDRKKRAAHIEAIVELVEDGDFDGINIDYEQKLAKTKDYFSRFLRDLEDELGRHELTCTIEARTPPESRWRTVPSMIEYANDYEAMARYCDWVEIMAYDQQRADWRLNQERQGEPYIPVADTDWVEKVVELALEDIPADQIILGVPTYGRHWTLTVEPEWFKEYDSNGAVNLPDAEALARQYDVEPGRNAAGELSFSFFPEDSVFSLLDALPTPEGTRSGMEAAAKALLFANATGMTVPVDIVWYSDAEAIEAKQELAKEYDLRGLAIFKVDGEEDENIWDLF